MRTLLLTLAFLGCFGTLLAQFPSACDVDKSCVGLAYTGTVSTGKGANYIDVEKTKAQDSISTAMSFEFWINATKQPGTRVYLAGKWGPYTNNDNNDSWALYIDPSDHLVFELNGQGDNLGPTDNTVVQTTMDTLYGKWNHVCAVFDGSTHQAILYINAQEVARSSNAAYPLSTLRVPNDPALGIFIGSTNDIARYSTYRTFIGQLDEIRMWKRVLSPIEIYCMMERSLAGNENGLVFYYRCNDNNSGSNAGILCDATGKGNIGHMVQVQTCQKSSRTVSQKIITDITSITDDIKCSSTKSWVINVTDTSYQSCGNSYSFSMSGADASAFSVSPKNATLVPNISTPITITFNGALSGSISAQFVISGNNRCVTQKKIPISITRSTELLVRARTLSFDTLYAKCVSTPYYDSAIVICNTTGPTGTATNRNVTVFGGSMNVYGGVFQLMPPKGKTFPLVLGIGQCDTLWLRFHPTIDTTFNYTDTLHISSDDACAGSGVVVVKGTIVEVFSIRDYSTGKKRIDSLTFQNTCPKDISNPSQAINWFNLTDRNIIIDSMHVPSTIVRVGFPKIPPAYTLLPSAKKGEGQKYLRFKPAVPGLINNDPIIFYYHLQGFNCQFVDTLKWSGRGLDNDVLFSTASVDYGNVVVGKDSTIAVTFLNKSATDVMNISFYLKKGDVFVFPGTNTASLNPGQQRTISITFRPTDSLWYYDTLCLFETRCYTTQCIPLRGHGIIERFRFDPIVMNVENVVGCRDSIVSLDIINESSVNQTLKNFSLVQPGVEFSPVDQNGNPAPLAGLSFSLNPGERHRFYFRFTPNTTANDIAIIAYLQYTTSLTTDIWKVKLFGSSQIPRLYVSPLTIYGVIEVGDTRRDSVTIENSSAIPVLVDSLSIPNGYTLISLSKTLPRVLQPRDSVTAVIDFTPTSPGVYNKQVGAYSSQPCPNISSAGDLQGKTLTVELDASLTIQNFSYTRPCDCVVRDIPLTNNSFVNSMTIDSMGVDSLGIPGGTPQLFTFSSYYYNLNGKTLPFSIPPRSTDTVHIVFCPHTTAEVKNTNCVARFSLEAHGAGWGPKNYVCFLSGVRSMIFQPTVTQIGFPGTRVDTLSAPRADSIAIPGVIPNPTQEIVQIDSITYQPDERVFFHTDTLNNPIAFPVVIDPGTKPYPFKFFFKPRAPRQGAKKYQARAVLHYSKPCIDIDTTILLTGEGRAPAYGLQMTFDNNRVGTDTFRIVSCDTLHIPVYSSREIPAPTVDIQFDAVYDTTMLRFINATSMFNPPTTQPSLQGGIQVLTKDCRNVDSLLPIVVMNFVPRVNATFTTPFLIDSIFFDTQEILNYYLSAGGDNGIVAVDKADMKIQKPLINFDSVRVLDCVVDSFAVKNTGDVALSVDSVLVLPRDVQFLSSTPPRGTLLQPGESADVVVQYCPRSDSSFDSLSYALTDHPCRLIDSLQLLGKGYVPILPIHFATDPTNFVNPAALGGNLSDTLVVPIYLDSNFATTYHGTTYWLQDMSFGLGLSWDKYMLKYVDGNSIFGAKMSIQHPRYDSLALSWNHVDSVHAGKIAELRFVILVPDTSEQLLHIVPDSVFKTDSLLFLKLSPIASQTQIQTGSKCFATTARSAVGSSTLYQSYPNPATNRVSFRFDIQESVPAVLSVYNATGEQVATLMDGTQKLQSGQHSIDWDVSHLPPGVYTYTLYAGIFSAKRTMIIVH